MIPKIKSKDICIKYNIPNIGNKYTKISICKYIHDHNRSYSLSTLLHIDNYSLECIVQHIHENLWHTNKK